MRKLISYPLCPFSRQVRIMLAERNLTTLLVKEDYWLRSKELLRLNPAGELPVLIEPTLITIADVNAIIEYLNQTYPEKSFFPEDVILRAEVRRMIAWFNNKFYREVIKYILNEKLIRLYQKAGAPKSELLRAAKNNMHHHFIYLTKLLEEREYIAYDTLSQADFVASSHISVLDYFDEINWELYPRIKYWYSLIKSRPSYRDLLRDNIAGFKAPKHYAILDF